MTIARVRSFAFSGIEAVPVEVQVQISSGLPALLVMRAVAGLAAEAYAWRLGSRGLLDAEG